MKTVKRFTASWCGPCKLLAPVFLQLLTEFPDVSFETIDVDQYKDISHLHEVKSVPTVIIGEKRFVGVKPKSVYSNAIKSLV